MVWHTIELDPWTHCMIVQNDKLGTSDKVDFSVHNCLVDALVPGLAVKGADAAHLPVVEGYLLKAKRESE